MPTTLPLPPAMLVPPMMAAATTTISVFKPSVGLPCPSPMETSAPPRADSVPDSMNPPRRYRSTRSPENHAVCRLPPSR